MNFKKTTLALAMAGIVAAPMAAQAAAGDGAYASIRIGLQIKEANGGEGVAGGTEDTIVDGLGSRFGFKSETDLGNGMTGFGQYEFGVDAEQTSFAGTAANTIRTRKAYVGVKGDFGSVSVGTNYQTFYKHVVGPTDNPWWGSGYAMVAYNGRQTNGLTYAGGAGAISYGVTMIMAPGQASAANGDSETFDQMQFGLSFDAGFGTFGLGYIDGKGAGGVDPDPIIGLLVSGIAAGPVTLGVGYQMQDVGTASTSSFLIDVGFNNFYLHLESKDLDAPTGAGDKFGTTLGYTKSLGPQTTAWFEYHDVDTDTATGSAGDLTNIRAMLKYDI